MKNTMIKLSNAYGSTTYIVFPSHNVDDAIKLFTETGVKVLNTFEAGNTPFEELPDEMKEDVKETLKAFHECTVIFENGKFLTSAGISIKSSYADDHFVCGTYKDDQIYTLEERRANYKECFGYAPRF